MLESFFIKVAGLRFAVLSKRKVRHRPFLMMFAIYFKKYHFYRTPASYRLDLLVLKVLYCTQANDLIRQYVKRHPTLSG